jgi:RNA polymerase sigma factor (sigma-70 family)
MSDSWTFEVSGVEFRKIDRELKGYFRRRVPMKCASELAADTWVSITRWYRGRCALRGFAFLVARKKVADAYREREIRATPLADADEPATEDPGPHSVLELLANHAAIERVLKQVDEAVFHDVIGLWLAGRDPVEIAADLGVPYNTVRSRLQRGRAQMLTALRAEFGLE